MVIATGSEHGEPGAQVGEFIVQRAQGRGSAGKTAIENDDDLADAAAPDEVERFRDSHHRAAIGAVKVARTTSPLRSAPWPAKYSKVESQPRASSLSTSLGKSSHVRQLASSRSSTTRQLQSGELSSWRASSGWRAATSLAQPPKLEELSQWSTPTSSARSTGPGTGCKWSGRHCPRYRPCRVRNPLTRAWCGVRP